MACSSVISYPVFLVIPQVTKGYAYNKKIQQPNTHPETPPERMDHCDKGIAGCVAIESRDKLAQTTPERDKGEEYRRRAFTPPSSGDVASCYEGRPCEPGESECCGRSDGLQEY